MIGPVSRPMLRLPRVTTMGRRRFAAVVAGSVAVVGTGAVASQEPPSAPTPAATRLQHDRVVSYPADQVWPTAIRFLRVDRAYTLIDRDRESGFILFDFPLDNRPDAPQGRGSLELVATTDPVGRPAVRLQFSTDAGPPHLPHALADGLSKKLKAERGQPAPPPQPEPAPPPKAPLGPWAPDPTAD